MSFDLLPTQIAPPGGWTFHQFVGKPGSGSTFAGAHWLSERINQGDRNLAFVAPSEQTVRDVMVTAFLLHQPNAIYVPNRRQVIAGHATINVVTEPDGLRGLQLHAAWVCDFGPRDGPRKFLENLAIALRLGDRPQAVLSGYFYYPISAAGTL